jgi:hypothetical protein
VEPARAAAAAETTAPAAPAASPPSPTPAPSPAPASNGTASPPAAGPQVVAPVNPSVTQPVPPSVTQPAPPPVTGTQAPPPAPTVPLQPVPPAPPAARPPAGRSAPPQPVAPTPPVPPPAPEMPVVPAQQPGLQQPGLQQPGLQQPGLQQPGAPQQPGSQQPGSQQPGSQQPGAQRPGAAQTRRRQHVDEPVDEPPPEPGDLICGQCGAGNVPTRRFCRRCGNSLADAPVAGKKSWWRRLLDWFNGDSRRRYEAGHRRKVRLPSRVRKLILLLLVVAVGGFLVLVPGRGPIRSGINMARDRLAKRVEVTPARTEASSSAPGSSPQQAIDGATNTFWAPAARGDSAVGGWVQAEFTNPVRLLNVIVHPGVAPDRPTFLTEGRPKALRITVTSKNGKVTNKDVTLPDVQGSHKYSVKASDAVTVRFTLLSAYGAQVGRVVAIAELEFFVRG